MQPTYEEVQFGSFYVINFYNDDLNSIVLDWSG